MYVRNSRFYLIGILFIFLSCTKQEKNNSRSFYCWQSTVQFNENEIARLESLQIEKLYIRFFDVSWDKSSLQPLPVSLTNISSAVAEKFQIVPVVFITNESISNLDTNQIKTLAYKISKLTEALLAKNKIAAPSEIQIDCDWNEKTKENYFLLLNELKKFPARKNCIWTATIRLHQIKFYEQTGVPPVNRGTLMFYNMGNVEDYHAPNSIYQTEIAKQYLGRIDAYPLPLDAAIACYSWGLLFEDQKLLKIFYPLSATDLPDSLFTKQSNQMYSAKKNFYFEGQFMTTGDEIKIETMSPALAIQSAKLLSTHLKNESRSVILYHLDSTVLNQYSDEEFENLFNCFN